ncbi:MAG: triacylglycerol lipase [Pedobacter sp.]|nr:triacylglycerol lipase [Pedobacter sp.]
MKKVFAAALMVLSGLATAGTYTQTKYPIVLAPGVLGFDKILGIEYFYGIPAALGSDGAKVYVTSASAFNTSEARGEQMLAQVQTILAISGAQKVNLIGHSHGGFSSRYVAAAIPTRVASVTAVGSPVKGTPVADLVVQFTANPAIGGLVGTVGNAFSKLISTLGGKNYNEDILGSMASLSTAGAANFNARFPAGVPVSACGEGAYSANGQRFYSWGGTSLVTNILDPLDILFGTTSLAFAGKASDGLVGQCSSHFGQVLRDDYSWNHGDEINHLLSLRGLFTTDPKSVYRDQANRLKTAGL